MQGKEGGHDAALLLWRKACCPDLLVAGQLGVGERALHRLAHAVQQLLHSQIRPCTATPILYELALRRPVYRTHTSNSWLATPWQAIPAIS